MVALSYWNEALFFERLLELNWNSYSQSIAKDTEKENGQLSYPVSTLNILKSNRKKKPQLKGHAMFVSLKLA